MGKIERKRKKLEERIEQLQNELVTSLTKKSSHTVEIDVPNHQRKINEMKIKLRELK